VDKQEEWEEDQDENMEKEQETVREEEEEEEVLEEEQEREEEVEKEHGPEADMTDENLEEDKADKQGGNSAVDPRSLKQSDIIELQSQSVASNWTHTCREAVSGKLVGMVCVHPDCGVVGILTLPYCPYHLLNVGNLSVRPTSLVQTAKKTVIDMLGLYAARFDPTPKMPVFQAGQAIGAYVGDIVVGAVESDDSKSSYCIKSVAFVEGSLESKAEFFDSSFKRSAVSWSNTLTIEPEAKQTLMKVLRSDVLVSKATQTVELPGGQRSLGQVNAFFEAHLPGHFPALVALRDIFEGEEIFVEYDLGHPIHSTHTTINGQLVDTYQAWQLAHRDITSPEELRRDRDTVFRDLQATHTEAPLLKQSDVTLLRQIYDKLGTEAVIRAWTMREKELLEAFLKLETTPVAVPQFRVEELKTTERVHTPKQSWNNFFSSDKICNTWAKSNFDKAATLTDEHFKKDPQPKFSSLVAILRDAIWGCGAYGAANLARILYINNGWYTD
jgi:hypothetical protein